jgi:hypothetical protein
MGPQRSTLLRATGRAEGRTAPTSRADCRKSLSGGRGPRRGRGDQRANWSYDGRMGLSSGAQELFSGIADLYVKAGHPAPKIWWFSPKTGQIALFGELQAHGLIKQLNRRSWHLTDKGVRVVIGEEPEFAGLIHIHHGDVVTSTITNSVVGANAVGAGPSAEGNSVSGNSNAVTQERHRELVGEAQAALVQDQDKLDEIDSRLFDALNQFLRIARTIQVEQSELADVQRRMKETLDEVWVKLAADDLRPRLPEATKVAEVLMKVPAVAQALKALLEG